MKSILLSDKDIRLDTLRKVFDIYIILAKKIGSISIPKIEHFKLSEEDKFIVLGSDGLFDVFETHEICGFVDRYLKNNE